MSLELRYALRSLSRAPGLSAVIIVTLMVGIASMTTIFSLVNTALFRPSPYPGGSRIRAIGEQHPHQPAWFSSVSARNINTIRAGIDAFDRWSVYRDRPTLLTLGGVTTPLEGIEADSVLLPLLGVHAERGRLFSPTELAATAPVALISDSLWRTLFASDSAIVGRSVRVEGMFVTIVGVLPQGFRFPSRCDVWFPLASHIVENANDTYSLLGRLRTGASVQHARQELSLLAASLAAEDPGAMAGMSLILRDDIVDRGNRAAIGDLSLIFLAAAGCVLLVACVNVGNLLQVRAAERRVEMALRKALGASGARLMRQNLTESLVLGSAGGALGTLVSMWTVTLLSRVVPAFGFPSWLRLGMDATVRCRYEKVVYERPKPKGKRGLVPVAWLNR